MITGLFSSDKLLSQTSAFDQLIEEGYEVFYSDTLRTHGKEFVLAALKSTDEDSLMFASNTTVQRPLLILKKQTSTTFDIAFRNDNLILCVTCGGELGSPFESIETGNSSFTINHFGGSSYPATRNTTFSYNSKQNQWELTSDRGTPLVGSSDSDGEIIYTPIDPDKKVLFESFNIYHN